MGSATTRRGFMDSVASATAAIAGVSSALMSPAPAMAYGLGKANDKLARWVIFAKKINMSMCTTFHPTLCPIPNLTDAARHTKMSQLRFTRTSKRT